MHCISIYPSNDFDLQIGFIKSMKKRYPEIPIGWSTHENPETFLLIISKSLWCKFLKDT